MSVVALATVAMAAVSSRPHIVFIVADDLVSLICWVQGGEGGERRQGVSRHGTCQ